MPAVVGLAWTVYGGVSIAFFAFSTLFTRYYQHKHESERLATMVTMIALGLIFSTLGLLPVDIFLVSSTVDQNTGLKYAWATPEIVQEMMVTVQTMYYVCYGLVGVFSFLCIPFAYFYFEEYEENQSQQERIASAVKYTSFFLVISLVLLVFGLFLRPTQAQLHLDFDWMKRLLSENSGEKAFSFVIGCLFLLGMVVFVFYTAPGLSILPLNMIKGKRHLEVENIDVENRLIFVREKLRALQAKYIGGAPQDEHIGSAFQARYIGSARNIPFQHQEDIDALEEEETVLAHRLQSLKQDRHSKWKRLVKSVRPIEVLIGFFLLAFSFIIIASIFLTIVDKIAYSVCGSQCGYIIDHPQLFNPINFIFIKLAEAFPLDYLFMVSLILYFFLATLSGVIHMGLRFLWVTLFQIKKGSTAPQGLLFFAILLTLGLLALNYTLITVVAPGYSHFGSQVYCNQTLQAHQNCSDRQDLIVACHTSGPTDICTPTVSSILVDKITINTPFFGDIFYFSQWGFLAVFILGFAVALFRSPRNNVDTEDMDLIEAEEENELLRQRQRVYS
ncbi:hypothetical protein BDF14DRAFT_1784551 [Spinellus fusiger]|nr:hypothetical protein BDF14DRAFT_1784551 [Spinellus fusiger]